MTRRSTMRDAVAEVMAVGIDPLDPSPDPEGLDTPLGTAAADASELAASEKPEPDDRAASERGAVGRLVAELLADRSLGYKEIVDKVRTIFPTAGTTVRSVASTACLMRRKGADVPARRKEH